ncbi:MAG: hypothetical protein K2H92_09460, partial [Bacteroidaceae bacterium]|nr:hypothetical protein [Bacteroidaceae bacterium]
STTAKGVLVTPCLGSYSDLSKGVTQTPFVALIGNRKSWGVTLGYFPSFAVGSPRYGEWMAIID